MHAEFIELVIASGLTPEAYEKVAQRRAAVDPSSLEGMEAERAEFAKLHLFYGRNRGRALDGEWVAVLGRLLDGDS